MSGLSSSQPTCGVCDASDIPQLAQNLLSNLERLVRADIKRDRSPVYTRRARSESPGAPELGPPIFPQAGLPASVRDRSPFKQTSAAPAPPPRFADKSGTTLPGPTRTCNRRPDRNDDEVLSAKPSSAPDSDHVVMGVRGILVCEGLEPVEERVSVEVVQPARRRKVARAGPPPGGRVEFHNPQKMTQTEVEESLATLHECLQMAARLEDGNKTAPADSNAFRIGENIGRRMKENLDQQKNK